MNAYRQWYCQAIPHETFKFKIQSDHDAVGKIKGPGEKDKEYRFIPLQFIRNNNNNNNNTTLYLSTVVKFLYLPNYDSNLPENPKVYHSIFVR